MSFLNLKFSHDGKNTDGTAFGAAQFAGVEYQVDGAPFATVPALFAADGKYDLNVEIDLPAGPHSATVRIKHADGTVSDASAAATFSVAPGVPSAPFGLSAAYSR